MLGLVHYDNFDALQRGLRHHIKQNCFAFSSPVLTSCLLCVLQVLGIDLKDPVSKNPLPVTNLPQPLTLTFTVSALPVGKQRGCNYFKKDTKTWDKKGMTAVDGGNNTLNCLSTHATFFAPSNDASNATNATTAPPTTAPPTVGGRNRFALPPPLPPPLTPKTKKRRAQVISSSI